jgi:hypothetical protein
MARIQWPEPDNGASAPWMVTSRQRRRAIRELEEQREFTCVRCRRQGPVSGTLSAIVYVDDDPATSLYVVKLAHAGCAAPQVLTVHGLAAAAVEEPEQETTSICMVRAQAKPSPLLVFWVTQASIGERGEDLWMQMHLRAGFQRLAVSLDVCEPHLVASWWAELEGDTLTVYAGSRDDVEYREDFAEERREWLAWVRAAGSLVLATGRVEAAEVAPGADLMPLLERAVEREQLVAATLRLREGPG